MKPQAGFDLYVTIVQRRRVGKDEKMRNKTKVKKDQVSKRCKLQSLLTVSVTVPQIISNCVIVSISL